jgi:hypothetical protein
MDIHRKEINNKQGTAKKKRNEEIKPGPPGFQI